MSNIFLYDLGDAPQVYQLTDFYTGVQGITPLSPVLSWAREADRLAFVYYEERSTTSTASPTRGGSGETLSAVGRLDSVGILARVVNPPLDTTRTLQVREEVRPQVGEGGSIYRTPQGFRSSSEVVRSGDTTRPMEPVSIVALLDSANYSLPDTSEFTLKEYRIKFSPDYVARPSIGYARDNFGRGFFGGSAISLSDILGNQQLMFAGYVNGRISEAQILAAYANLSKRINWAVGISQDPYYFLEPSQILPAAATGGEHLRHQHPPAGGPLGVRHRRTIRSAGSSGSRRGCGSPTWTTRILQINEPYNPATGFATDDPFLETDNLPGRHVRPADRGAGVRQLALRLRRTVLRPALPLRAGPDRG